MPDALHRQDLAADHRPLPLPFALAEARAGGRGGE